MFCYLFDIKRVGLRLSTLDKAMCPKFHVDRVPCRLVTTYNGPVTQWLPNTKANRNKLGLVSAEKTNETSVFSSDSKSIPFSLKSKIISVSLVIRLPSLSNLTTQTASLGRRHSILEYQASQKPKNREVFKQTVLGVVSEQDFDALRIKIQLAGWSLKTCVFGILIMSFTRTLANV